MRPAGERFGGCDRPSSRLAGAQFCCDAREPAVRVAGEPLCGINVSVPTDGPDGWYRPTEAAHFDALGVNVPDLLYLCQDAAGSLQPAIGASSLPTAGTGHVYQQSEAGWTAAFVGYAGGSGRGWREALSTLIGGQLGAGESWAMAMLARIDAALQNDQIMHLGTVNGLRSAGSSGAPRTVHATITTSGSNSLEGAVRQMGWYRRADIDASGTVTDLEALVGTHDEAVVGSSATAGIGASGTSAATLMRCCWFAIWRGGNAEFSMSAALAALRGA